MTAFNMQAVVFIVLAIAALGRSNIVLRRGGPDNPRGKGRLNGKAQPKGHAKGLAPVNSITGFPVTIMYELESGVRENIYDNDDSTCIEMIMPSEGGSGVPHLTVDLGAVVRINNVTFKKFLTCDECGGNQLLGISILNALPDDGVRPTADMFIGTCSFDNQIPAEEVTINCDSPIEGQYVQVNYLATLPLYFCEMDIGFDQL